MNDDEVKQAKQLHARNIALTQCLNENLAKVVELKTENFTLRCDLQDCINQLNEAKKLLEEMQEKVAVEPDEIKQAS